MDYQISQNKSPIRKPQCFDVFTTISQFLGFGVMHFAISKQRAY